MTEVPTVSNEIHDEEERDLIDAADLNQHGTPLYRSAPERIVLAIGDELEDWMSDFSDCTDVTWCDESVVSVEVGYVRGDLYDAAIAERDVELELKADANRQLNAGRRLIAEMLAVMECNDQRQPILAAAREFLGEESAAPLASPHVATPFTPYTEQELREWYPVMCNRCGWHGLSRDCAGGGAIADTGDFDDIYCPKCWDAEHGGAKVDPREVIVAAPVPASQEARDPYASKSHDLARQASEQDDARDAERWRWLRENGKEMTYDALLEIIEEYGDRADAKLDAARLAAKKEGR